MGIFKRLPPEVLLQILENLEDFATLDDLLSASPAINQVFESYAARITDAMLLNCTTTKFEDHRTAHAIAAIKSSGYDCPSLRRFIESVPRIPSIGHLERNYGLSWKSIRELIRGAACVQKVASTCLEMFLDRLKAIQITTISPGLLFRRKKLRPFGGTPLKTIEAGSPSWLELFCVHGAVWWLYLRNELSKASKLLYDWDWGVAEREAITNDFASLWDVDVSSEEFLGVEELMCECLCLPNTCMFASCLPYISCSGPISSGT